MAGNETVEAEEVGLSSWPMSRSYPATSTHVQMEARKILRTMMTGRKETEVVLNSSKPEEIDTSKQGHLSKGRFGPLCCTSSTESETLPESPDADIDEVDGMAEDILRPLVKLLFLKILLVDIGISLGDVITDLLQGLNLVFDGDWNIQWSTYHYGLGILTVIWLPGLVVLLHQASGETAYRLFPESSLGKFGKSILFFIFFPLVPSILYLRVLFTKRAFNAGRQMLVFLKLEATSHEIKAIAGALQSPIELIILVWLLLRGILQLPWDHSLASSCVEDSLGRVACLPSLPVASIIFSLLSILKALYDLNVTPLVSSTDQAQSVLKLSYSCQLQSQLCPFFVSNILFRCFSFAFIITYLDNWVVIPGSIVLLLIVAHTTLLSYSQPGESEEEPRDEGGSNALQTQRDTRSSCSQDEEEHYPVRQMPVFLNSVLGFFLPVAYTPPAPENGAPEQGKLGSLVRVRSVRQAKALRSQALLVNTCTLVVVIVVYLLVRHTTTFNYRSNILTPWWFNVAFLYLVLMFLCSCSLSWLPEPPFLQEKADEDPPSASTRQRSRHPTEESSRLSVHSTTSNLVKEEQGPSHLGLRAAYSVLLISLILAPTIIGLILFTTLPDNDILLQQVNEGDDGLVHRHFTHLTSLNPDWNRENLNHEYRLLHDCGDLADIEDSVLLVNMSISTCRSLQRRLATGVFGSQMPKALIILDDSPETTWRLSSPPTYIRLGQHLPVFRARAKDWSLGWTAHKVSFSRGIQQNDKVEGLKCSDDREVYVGQVPADGCQRRKWLHEDGRITETRCLTTSCNKNGLPCKEPTISSFEHECVNFLRDPVFVSVGSSKLAINKFMFNDSVTTSECCIDSFSHKVYHGKDCTIGVPDSEMCKSSPEYRLYPCLDVSNERHSQFCKIASVNCIVQKTILTLCDGLIRNQCNIQKYNCKNAFTLIK